MRAFADARRRPDDPYLLRRVLILLPVWLAVYTLTFTLYHVTPGGPWDREKPVPPQAMAQLNQKYGLDRPLWQQYLDYLAGVFTRFDFGPSYSRQSRNVSEIIDGPLPGLGADRDAGDAAGGGARHPARRASRPRTTTRSPIAPRC